MLDSLVPFISSSPHLLGYALETRIFVLIGLDSLARVKEDYDHLKEIISTGEYPYNPSTALDVAIALKNYMEAYHILQSVVMSPEYISESEVEYGYYKYYRAIGKSDSSLKHYENHIAFNQAYTMDLMNQSVALTRADWFKKESERHRDESARVKLILIGGSIIATLIILLLIISYRLLLYRTNTKINNFMAEMSQLSSRLQSKEASLYSLEERLVTDRNEHLKEKEGLITELTAARASLTGLGGAVSARDIEISDLRSTIADQSSAIAQYTEETYNLFGGKLKTIDQLCKAYFSVSNPTNDKDKRIIYNKVGEVVDDMCANIEFAKIEELVNRDGDNIALSFRKDFNDIDKLTYEIVILTFARLSSPVICRILHISKDNHYSRRKRLKSKIEKSDCRDKMRYLAALKMV